MKDEHADSWEVRHGSNFVLALFGVFGAWLFYKTPSALEPTLWKNPFPLPKLTGPLTPNTFLQHVEKATCSKEGNCISPESLVIDPSTGNMYASLADGRIVKLDKTGSFLANVFFLGGFVADPKTKNGLSADNANLMTWCKNEALAHRLAWNTKGEKTCGRPLGIRLSKNTLFFVDAYHGLFSLDLTTLHASHLVTSSTTIYPPNGEGTTASSLDPIAFLPPKFFNDIDLTSDKIYFTDSSYKNTRSENRAEVVDGAPRGRLFEYNRYTKQLTVLLCGLHFPNGVQLLQPSSPHSSSLLVAESARFRVLQVQINNNKNRPHPSLLSSCSENGALFEYLNGQSQQHGKTTNSYVKIFLDEAPGFIDNIRLESLSKSHSPTFLIGMGTKSSQPFSLLWWAYQLMIARQIMGKIFPMQWVEFLAPHYGLVLRVDNTGRVLESYHDKGGKHIAWISEAHTHPLTGDLFFGSHSNKFLGRLQKKYIST